MLRFVQYDAAGQVRVSYQREYTIKDHLGNLRLAYRAGQLRTLLATLEQDETTHKRESQQFDSLSVSAPVALSTSLARSGAYAARLNAGGSAPQPLGPLTQLGVQKGDTLTVSAYGLYPQAQQHGFFFSLASFIAGILHPASPPPPGLDGRKRQDLPLLQVGVAAGLASIPQLSGGVPQAYLRVLVFNRDSALVDQLSQQLTKAAAGNYERLNLQVVLPQDGYVSAYVGSASDVDVFFDDVQVEHRPGLQVQENSYEPWGLSLAGLDYSSPGIRGLNKYQFNGKERQTDLGLGWSDYGARFYDPARGPVWNGVDLLADAVSSWSPYAFSMDNAVLYTDMTGMLPGFDPEAELTGAPHKGFQPNNSSHYIAQGGSGTKLPVSNGIPQATLPEVSVTGTSSGPAWAKSVIRNYQSSHFFSVNPNVAPNAYGWTESEINNGLKYEVMAVATLFGGGAAIADIGAGALFEGGVVSFGTRATADVGIQTIAGRLSGQSWGESLASVNLLESGMAGAGFNPMSMGTLTAGFGYSKAGGPTSSFTPGSSLTAFLLKSAIGTSFGWAGGMLAKPSVTATIGLSVALRTSSGGLGVQVGQAATHAMEKSVGVAEEYYEGQVDKNFPAK